MAFVGEADPNDVRETTQGLLVRGKLDLSNPPLGAQTHKLLKSGALGGWSFGYIVPPDDSKRRNGITEISKVELLEVGPTLRGANREARTLAVKSHGGAPDELTAEIARKSNDELRAELGIEEKSSEPVRIASFEV